MRSLLVLVALLCLSCAPPMHGASWRSRVEVLHQEGYGTHFWQLVRVDDKEYIIVNHGGVIEHK